jgi:hypothetical protein
MYPMEAPSGVTWEMETCPSATCSVTSPTCWQTSIGQVKYTDIIFQPEVVVRWGSEGR